MRTLHVLAVALGVALFAAGCQRDDSSLAAKLEQIDKRLTSIEGNLAKIAAGGGRGGPGQQRPQRPMPKPDETYSVPVAGAPA